MDRNLTQISRAKLALEVFDPCALNFKDYLMSNKTNHKFAFPIFQTVCFLKCLNWMLILKYWFQRYGTVQVGDFQVKANLIISYISQKI